MQLDRAQALWTHVKASMFDAVNQQSDLSHGALHMMGLSGRMTRHLYNNLVRLPGSQEVVTYLEVGSWAGSTLVAALQGNESRVQAIAIDNWSQFDGPKELFMKHVQEFTSPARKFDHIDKDSFQVTFDDLGRRLADVYLYDGGHEREDHRRGIAHYADFLADASIVIVDDWNWEKVRGGTFEGFEEVKDRVRVYASLEIRHTDDDSHTPKHVAEPMFHNGIAVFVVYRIKEGDALLPTPSEAQGTKVQRTYTSELFQKSLVAVVHQTRTTPPPVIL